MIELQRLHFYLNVVLKTISLWDNRQIAWNCRHLRSTTPASRRLFIIMKGAMSTGWRVIGPQKYEQEYSFMEKVYRTVSVPAGKPGRFLLGTCIQFRTTRQDKIDGLAEAFRRAWAHVRHDFPDIACLPGEHGKAYISLDLSGELEAWMSQTFVVLDGKSMLDVWRDLVKTNQPTLFYLTKTNQLFLQTEHYHLDGRGMLHFWDIFFRAVAYPAETRYNSPDEANRLQPRPLDIAEAGHSSVEDSQRVAEELMQPLKHTGARIKMPAISSIPEGAPSHSSEETKLEVDVSKAIIASCKKRRLSITGVWHAAIVFATRDQQLAANETVGSTYVGLANFDLRKHYSADRAGTYPFGDHHCVLPMALNIEEKTISAAASELTDFYWNRIAAAGPSIWHALPITTEKLTPALTAQTPTDSTPSAASLGLVDAYIKHSYGARNEWIIDDFWAGNTVAGPSIKCFLYTWRGRIVLNSCYNSDFYDKETLQRFHTGIANWMLRALDMTPTAQVQYQTD